MTHRPAAIIVATLQAPSYPHRSCVFFFNFYIYFLGQLQFQSEIYCSSLQLCDWCTHMALSHLAIRGWGDDEEEGLIQIVEDPSLLIISSLAPLSLTHTLGPLHMSLNLSIHYSAEMAMYTTHYRRRSKVSCMFQEPFGVRMYVCICVCVFVWVRAPASACTCSVLCVCVTHWHTNSHWHKHALPNVQQLKRPLSPAERQSRMLEAENWMAALSHRDLLLGSTGRCSAEERLYGI